MTAMTSETVLPRLSTGDLDLENLPDRLTDEMTDELDRFACSPLPDLIPCDKVKFQQSLRMMLAALPRRQSDDVSGELFVAAYEMQLGVWPEERIDMLLRYSLRECKWFPTIAECFDLTSMWRRKDKHTEDRRKARSAVGRENEQRRKDEWNWSERSSMLMTQKQVDNMAPVLHEIGLKCGALMRDESGKVVPVREWEGYVDEDGVEF